MQYTPPGDIYQADFRPSGISRPANSNLNILTWNIERGYKLSGIIDELKKIDADIIGLQEVDVGCDRSGGADTGELGTSLRTINETLT